ncbi:MAG: hypothetical protein ACLFQV_09965, partial [Vulcanimicrobiota bacterium]
MDCLDITGYRFEIPENQEIIAILPGSRDFAYSDFPIILEALEIIENRDKHFAYVAPLAGSIEVEKLAEVSKKRDFELIEKKNDKGLMGIIRKGPVEVLLVRGRFGDAIHKARLVIGQAGTGNEQAVGLGKPTIAFDSGGKKKSGWYRARQKGLLGNSLSVVRRDSRAIADETLEILEDSHKYQLMSRIGRERLGPPGGAKNMADEIFKIYSKLEK